MKLTSRQLNQLHQALLHSFDRDALRMMVRLQLDENLEAITGDDDLATVVFDLITWAERTNRVGDLVSGALASNPNNPELQQLAADYARWQADAPADAPVAAPSAQPAAAPVTLPVEGRRGANLLLLAGAALVLVLIAAWLLRPYLLPTGSVEPTPVEQTTIGPTPVETAGMEPTTVEPTEVEPTEVEPTDEPAVTIEPPAAEATGIVENGGTDRPSLPDFLRTPIIIPATLLPKWTPSVTPTPQPPRAPALRVGAGLTAFNEQSRLLTIKSGESLTLDMRQLWSAPLDTPVDCAGGVIAAGWQVRQPYPGGEELEIRRTVPRAGGQTELLGRGARGNVTLGYCDELILQNLGLEDYRLEWRYVSAIYKP